MATKSPSDLADKLLVRVPDGMRDGLKILAKANRRSVNAEVVFQLERVLAQAVPKDQEIANAR